MPWLRYSSRDIRTANSLWLRVVVWSLCVLMFGAIDRASAQSSGETHLRAVRVTSNPPGAMIWVKDGRDYTCTNTVTPGTIELTFHGSNDAKQLRLARFGYAKQKVLVGAGDETVAGTLTPWSTSFFSPSADASPDVRELDQRVKTAFEQRLLAQKDAFPCADFDFRSIAVVKSTATQRLALYVLLDLSQSPAWRKVRLGKRTSDADRQQRIAQTALETGVADVLARFRPIISQFPELQDVVVASFYSSTEAVLDTEYVRSTVWQHQYKLKAYEGMVLETTPVSGLTENTVVKDVRTVGTVTFSVPAGKLPASDDKQVISNAVMASGEIKVEKLGTE